MNVQSRRVACIGARAGRGGTCPQTFMSKKVTWVSVNAFTLNINPLLEIRQLLVKRIFLKIRLNLIKNFLDFI